MTFFTKFLIFIFLFWLFLRIFGRFILKWILMRFLKKLERDMINQQNMFSDMYANGEKRYKVSEDLTIIQKDEQKPNKENKGDYIDFEELK